MVVYALLNSSDSIHYVKVTRAFNDENKNALELAQDPNQLFFDSLVVTLLDLNTGQQYKLEKERIAKNEGIFNSEVNYVYAIKKTLINGRRYRIEVFNPISGQKAYGETQVLNPVAVSTPNQNLINSYQIRVDGQGEFPIIFDGVRESELYEAAINLVFEEIDVNNGSRLSDTVRIGLGSGRFGTSSRRVFLRNNAQFFYNEIGRQLEIKPGNIERNAKSLFIEIWTGDSDMATYREVYGDASIGVVQKKTDYTNVQNGYGLIASRNSVYIIGTQISAQIAEELRVNDATFRLNFK